MPGIMIIFICVHILIRTLAAHGAYAANMPHVISGAPWEIRSQHAPLRYRFLSMFFLANKLVLVPNFKEYSRLLFAPAWGEYAAKW